MTRIVLEEVFKDTINEDGDPIKIKLGEVVIYTRDLTPERIQEIKDDTEDLLGYKKYKEVLKKEGFNI